MFNVLEEARNKDDIKKISKRITEGELYGRTSQHLLESLLIYEFENNKNASISNVFNKLEHLTLREIKEILMCTDSVEALSSYLTFENKIKDTSPRFVSKVVGNLQSTLLLFVS
jgi:hypothetical protein